MITRDDIVTEEESCIKVIREAKRHKTPVSKHGVQIGKDLNSQIIYEMGDTALLKDNIHAK